MKKHAATACVWTACITVLLVLAWGMGGRTGFDYGLTCTRCLREYHVVERNFLGVTYATSKTLGNTKPDYHAITGHECHHVYRKGGFGRSNISWFGESIRCGRTGEGGAYAYRNEAVRLTFELNKKLRNTKLSLRTLRLIDTLLPPDFDWKESHGRSEGRDKLLCFALAFKQVESEESWVSLLEVAEHGTLQEISNCLTVQTDASSGDRPSN
jgi:hypothetical protein